MTVGKAHLTKAYERWRIREPSEFKKSSFKTIGIGRKGWKSKRIIGKLKKDNEWATQAVLISRKEPFWVRMSLRQGARGLITQKIIRQKKMKV
jgi:hypothetical protein